MDWITNSIAIGNYIDAQQDLSLLGIDGVLCLRPNCGCPQRDDVDFECIPLKDGRGNRGADLGRALAYLQDRVRAGERVLVHCHAGRSRSVMVVARHLMDTGGIAPHLAIACIAERRTIELSEGIEELLSLRVE